MTLQNLNTLIEELEQSESSLSNIRNLSSLYIVRKEMIENINYDKVQTELDDILPSYIDYIITKKKFQLNEITEQAVFISMQTLCREIREFIQSLYSNTDTPKEREMIRNLIDQIKEIV